jgi:hypothetical protein
MTTPDLTQALAKVEQADTDRAAALAELDNAQRTQAAARLQAVSDARQDWVNQWDPVADEQAVSDARAALEEALRTGPLRPLLDVLLAEHRRTAHQALATRAQAAGATVPDYRPAPEPTAAAALLPQLLDNLATRTVVDETNTVEATVRAALDAVPGGRPIAYRITSKTRRDSWIEQIGGMPNLEWTNGAVTLAADDTRIDYFRRRTNHYQLEPLYVVTDPATIAPTAHPAHDSSHDKLADNHPGQFLLTPAERAAIARKTS